jgi:hypothetical protein
MAETAPDAQEVPLPSVRTEPVADGMRIILPPELGFDAATALHAVLLPLRDRSEAILAAGAVERISTAAVLVILSFINAREDRSPPAIVEHASGAFIDAFSELGLFPGLMRMEFRS